MSERPADTCGFIMSGTVDNKLVHEQNALNK